MPSRPQVGRGVPAEPPFPPYINQRIGGRAMGAYLPPNRLPTFILNSPLLSIFCEKPLNNLMLIDTSDQFAASAVNKKEVIGKNFDSLADA